jgi:hypothetical protein
MGKSVRTSSEQAFTEDPISILDESSSNKDSSKIQPMLDSELKLSDMSLADAETLMKVDSEDLLIKHNLKTLTTSSPTTKQSLDFTKKNDASDNFQPITQTEPKSIPQTPKKIAEIDLEASDPFKDSQIAESDLDADDLYNEDAIGWDVEGQEAQAGTKLESSVVNEVNESQEVTAKNSEDLLKKDFRVLSNEASADVIKRVNSVQEQGAKVVGATVETEGTRKT